MQSIFPQKILTGSIGINSGAQLGNDSSVGSIHLLQVVRKCRLQIKPDGVQRGLIADIIKRFEDKGYKLVGIKVMLLQHLGCIYPPHLQAESLTVHL